MPDAKPVRFSSRAMTLVFGALVAAALGVGAVATGAIPIPTFDSGARAPATGIATTEQSDQQQVQDGILSVGTRIQTMTPDIAKAHQFSRSAGILVLDVFANSPFERHGVRVNDLIVLIDGVPVTNVSELGMKVRLATPGQPLALVIDRGGVTQSISVPVARCLAPVAATASTCTTWSH
jgi:S1-C subfamily serine protease